AVSKLVGPISAFGIEIVEKTRGAVAIGVFANVARLFRLINIAAAIELNDLVVGAQIFVGVHHIGRNLLRTFTQLFLSLRDGIAGARDFGLVAIEDGQWNAEGKCGAAGTRSVRVAHSGGEVLFAVDFGKRQLAARGRDALLRGEQIGAGF